MKSKRKSSPSVRATLGCSDCHWNSARNNCIKFGFSSDDINQGKLVTTVNHGSFMLSNVKSCIIKITHDEHTANILRKESLERVRQETLKKMPDSGMVG